MNETLQHSCFVVVAVVPDLNKNFGFNYRVLLLSAYYIIIQLRGHLQLFSLYERGLFKVTYLKRSAFQKVEIKSSHFVQCQPFEVILFIGCSIKKKQLEFVQLKIRIPVHIPIYRLRSPGYTFSLLVYLTYLLTELYLYQVCLQIIEIWYLHLSHTHTIPFFFKQ